MTRTEQLTAISELPQQLERAVSGLTDEQLDTTYRDGGWTLRQVVHHISDSHINALIRMKLILAEDHPTLKPYSQDDWAKMADSTLAVGPSLGIVSGVHAHMVELLKNVEDAAWSRTAYHPENGEMTLGGILDVYAGHGKRHVEQITGLREQMGW